MKGKKKLLIVGFGLLGKEIFSNLSKFSNLYQVYIISTSIKKNKISSGFICDVTDKLQLLKISNISDFDIVFFCASSSKGNIYSYEKIFINGLTNILEIVRPKYIIFTSSTSVYHQTAGDIVDENSSTLPTTETGKILLKAEKLLLNYNSELRKICICRLGGLYGRSRSQILKNYFIDRNPVILHKDKSRFANQIHVEDAALAIIHLLNKIISKNKNSSLEKIYNLTDFSQLTYKDIYTKLFKLHPLYKNEKIELKNITENELKTLKRGWSNKRVSNKKLLSTSYKIKHSNFFNALQNDPQLLEKYISKENT